jgi:hypothetical protein
MRELSPLLFNALFWIVRVSETRKQGRVFFYFSNSYSNSSKKKEKTCKVQWGPFLADEGGGEVSRAPVDLNLINIQLTLIHTALEYARGNWNTQPHKIVDKFLSLLSNVATKKTGISGQHKAVVVVISSHSNRILSTNRELRKPPMKIINHSMQIFFHKTQPHEKRLCSHAFKYNRLKLKIQSQKFVGRQT